MFEIIVITIALIIIAILVLATTKPDSFRIERSATIKASAEKIFPLINDFKHWNSWSPWEKIDPQAVISMHGAENGVGAIREWKGNKQLGEGRMEILESSPPDKVVIKIDFIQPMAGHNTIEFTLVPQPDGYTRVTQAMYGPSPFRAKVMGLIFNMDKMVGEKYEQGLANLKAIVER